jgi:hypothetical protein
MKKTLKDGKNLSRAWLSIPVISATWEVNAEDHEFEARMSKVKRP